MTRKLLQFRFALAVVAGIAVTSCVCHADTLSFSGNMGSAGAVAFQVTIGSGSDLVIQTFGYGGGTNAAGTTFSGSGAQAGFMASVGLYDSTGNLFADGTQSPDYGCNDLGPGAANVDASSSCGDTYLSLNDYTSGVSATAPAGSYTVVIFAGYAPAVTWPDNNSYQFATDGSLTRYDGITPTDFYAFDVTGANISQPGNQAQVPEPSAMWLIAAGMPVWALRRRKFRQK